MKAHEFITEAVEDRTSYQVAKILADKGIKYDSSLEDKLISAIGAVMVKELGMNPTTVRNIISYDEDFLADTLSELQHMNQGVAEGEGNFAGDTPVNIGGATVKRLGVGDAVTYFGQPAKILAQSTDRKHSRITITKGMGGVTQNVLTSDLSRVGQGMAEDTPRFDPLVAKIAAKMKGPTENDAIAALITVLGTAAYNERPGFYRLWLGQAIDKYSQQGVTESSVTKKPQPYNEPNWAKNLPKDKLDAIAGPRYKKDKKQKS